MRVSTEILVKHTLLTNKISMNSLYKEYPGFPCLILVKISIWSRLSYLGLLIISGLNCARSFSDFVGDSIGVLEPIASNNACVPPNDANIAWRFQEKDLVPRGLLVFIIGCAVDVYCLVYLVEKVEVSKISHKATRWEDYTYTNENRLTEYYRPF